MKQRLINLLPRAEDMEVVKIHYPPPHSRRSDWWMQPMRFIAHDGRAK